MELREIPPRYRLCVKQRLAVVSFMQTRGVRGAARHFGLTRLTVREWRDRWRQAGLAGLIPRYPARRRRRVPPEVVELVRKARVDLEYGAARTRIWLLRVHQVRLAQATIQRVFRDIGIPRLRRGARRSRPRQMKLFEKEHPGDSVQVDVKVVKIGATKGYQYTALDDCTRYRVLRLYRRCNQESSRDFFAELRAALPFPIRQLQTDNGPEFSLDFSLSVQAAGIHHRHIRPRRPQQNGKVERSHRIDSEEFWSKHAFEAFTQARPALSSWESVYNHERFSMALHGLTPSEKLRPFLADVRIAS